MRRWLFIFQSALSLILFLATCATWFECSHIVSFANAPQIEVGPDAVLALTYRSVVFIRNLDSDGPEHSISIGVLAGGTIYDHGGRIMFVSLPYPTILFATAILPAIWLFRMRRGDGVGFQIKTLPDAVTGK
jgi:hypothetical protein